MLTPTDCVKDRLAAFYHWDDHQSLDQAVWVAHTQPIRLKEIAEWSKRENREGKFNKFKSLLKKIYR